MSRGRILAQRSDVVRVLINQAHTFGNGGSFDNGLNFTLSMGCGTWGGNQHHRKSQLPALSEYHPSRHHDPGRQAERGSHCSAPTGRSTGSDHGRREVLSPSSGGERKARDHIPQLIDRLRRIESPLSRGQRHHHELRRTRGEIADSGAGRQFRFRAVSLCITAAEAAHGGGEYRALRRSRRGWRRASVARPAASNLPPPDPMRPESRREPNPRYAHRRLHGRAAAGRRAGRYRRASSTPPSCTTSRRAKPLILFSTEGGMDIEDVAAAKPAAIRRLPVDIDGRAIGGGHRGHAQGPAPRCGSKSRSLASSLNLYDIYRARAMAELARDQSARPARRRTIAWSRLTVNSYSDDAADLSAAGDWRRRRSRRHDRAGETWRRGRPQADPARWQCRRARERRRA